MDETPSAMAERRGLQGAEAAAVLRFGLGEDDGSRHSEAVGEHLHTDPSLSAADSVASERRSVRTMAVGGVTLAVLTAAGIGFPHSGPDPTYVGAGRGSVVGPEVKAAGGSVGHPRDDTHKEQTQMSTLRNSIQSSVVAGATLIAASAGAQSAAVQWKASDGGNGHWYAVRATPRSQPSALVAAAAEGAHLVSIANSTENQFLVAQHYPYGDANAPYAYWTAGVRISGDSWGWATGEPWSFSNFDTSEPNGCCGSDVRFVVLRTNPQHEGRWDDTSTNGNNDVWPLPAIFEWDEDCNHDGIVDYGQCHDGTLADFNGNNTPDCCERGETCVVGSYPVQWRLEDGGNGHWYGGMSTTTAISWTAARDRATSQGGHLATISSRVEDDVVATLALTSAVWPSGDRYGPWLGGYQTSACSASYANWAWDTGEPWNYVSDAGFFDNSTRGAGQCDDYLHYIDHRRDWNDVREDGDLGVHGFMVEWDADCNQDNVVDYGQILLGQLADANNNGIPDICQLPTCRDVDLVRDGAVNGADLGILLIQWGVANANTVSDINHDGRVDGSDLAALLAFWGPCPQ
jgi:hypothetical protein